MFLSSTRFCGLHESWWIQAMEVLVLLWLGQGIGSHLHLGFHHVVRSANGLVDAAAKQRVIRCSPWDVSLCNCAVGYKTLVPRLFLSGCLQFIRCNVFFSKIYPLLLGKKKTLSLCILWKEMIHCSSQRFGWQLPSMLKSINTSQ